MVILGFIVRKCSIYSIVWKLLSLIYLKIKPFRMKQGHYILQPEIIIARVYWTIKQILPVQTIENLHISRFPIPNSLQFHLDILLSIISPSFRQFSSCTLFYCLFLTPWWRYIKGVNYSSIHLSLFRRNKNIQ